MPSRVASRSTLPLRRIPPRPCSGSEGARCSGASRWPRARDEGEPATPLPASLPERVARAIAATLGRHRARDRGARTAPPRPALAPLRGDGEEPAPHHDRARRRRRVGHTGRRERLRGGPAQAGRAQDGGQRRRARLDRGVRLLAALVARRGGRRDARLARVSRCIRARAEAGGRPRGGRRARHGGRAPGRAGGHVGRRGATRRHPAARARGPAHLARRSSDAIPKASPSPTSWQQPTTRCAPLPRRSGAPCSRCPKGSASRSSTPPGKSGVNTSWIRTPRIFARCGARASGRTPPACRGRTRPRSPATSIPPARRTPRRRSRSSAARRDGGAAGLPRLRRAPLRGRGALLAGRATRDAGRAGPRRGASSSARSCLGGVLSCVVAAGPDAVLKVAGPWSDWRAEATALTAWGGRGAPRLLAVDEERRALLLERIRPGTGAPEASARAVATLLAQLHLQPPPGLRSLAEVARERVERALLDERTTPYKAEWALSRLGELEREPPSARPPPRRFRRAQPARLPPARPGCDRSAAVQRRPRVRRRLLGARERPAWPSRPHDRDRPGARAPGRPRPRLVRDRGDPRLRASATRPRSRAQPMSVEGRQTRTARRRRPRRRDDRGAARPARTRACSTSSRPGWRTGG